MTTDSRMARVKKRFEQARLAHHRIMDTLRNGASLRRRRHRILFVSNYPLVLWLPDPTETLERGTGGVVHTPLKSSGPFSPTTSPPQPRPCRVQV